MDSEVIYNFEKKHSLTDSLTHLVNNIGLRDASATKKGKSVVFYHTPGGSARKNFQIIP